MKSLTLDAPQLGEHVWHSMTADPGIAAESKAHRERIDAVAAEYQPELDWSRARLLEIGAYRHYTGHLIAAERRSHYVVSDISAAALRDGARLAEAAGVQAKATMVVADFHDLPFTTGYFDVAMVVASVHHTRQPERVLQELMRVLKPGGLLVVANEPCARALCFHAFASNRPESMTPFESALNAAGLLPTLSSPFWGARPEHLFGMVENDRIPLSLYTETFAQEGGVLERTLAMHSLIGPFERSLMETQAKGARLRSEIRALLRSAVARATSLYGETERLLGYRLPTECEIHALAQRAGLLLEQRRKFANDDEWQAELFGAALSAVVRKRGTGLSPATEPFRRDMHIEPDGLVRERSDSSTAAAGLAQPLLPDIHACDDGAELEAWFPKQDWQWVHTDNKNLVNLKPESVIEVAPRAERTLLLVRYFAVIDNSVPYWVRFWAGGKLLDEQMIVLNESRLVRAWLPEGTAEIMVELETVDRTPIDAPWRIRIGVFQMFSG